MNTGTSENKSSFQFTDKTKVLPLVEGLTDSLIPRLMLIFGYCGNSLEYDSPTLISEFDCGELFIIKDSSFQCIQYLLDYEDSLMREKQIAEENPFHNIFRIRHQLPTYSFILHLMLSTSRDIELRFTFRADAAFKDLEYTMTFNNGNPDNSFFNEHLLDKPQSSSIRVSNPEKLLCVIEFIERDLIDRCRNAIRFYDLCKING